MATTTKSSSAPKKTTAAAKPAQPKAAAPKPAVKADSVKVEKQTSKPSRKASETLGYGTGRRKNAVARVWLSRGNGKFTVNGRDVTTYFARPVLRMVINQPFTAINMLSQFDVNCLVEGGGLSGQAGAVRHGLSRALDAYNAEFHKVLRQGGFLTRDSRVVERKKYGRRKARRSFQFSKR